MTGAPPESVGAVQVKTTCEIEVFVSSFVKLLGQLGALAIVAQLPVVDSKEFPREFYATSLADTEAPGASEKGEDRSILPGIVHAVFNLTVALLTPSQFAVSCDHVLSAF